ncbi:probable cytochrome P450 9f2 [Contarinia nasturtii]|uniref:probable cytochrome P450 9f2 n=1 Tax=Contarinia nasturtii TaxID=265458 RepID=UPI0012D378F6|nr:probable cytochrome P450 9f2 [Contarinia nasturtii]
MDEEFRLAMISTVLLAISWLFYDLFKTWYTILRSDIKCDFGIPPFGSHWREIFNIESWHSTLKRLYYKYPNERFVVLQGIGGRPEFLIRDPELLRQIAIRDFSSFVNRINDIHPGTDSMLGNQLTNLKTDEWRRIRNVLTPLLSGQKLKQIVIPSLNENKRELIEYLKDEIEKVNNQEMIVDMMDLSTRSCVDGFCLTAFGLKTDSLRPNGNEYGFLECSKKYMEYEGTLNRAVFWAVVWFPRIMKFLFGKTFMHPKDQEFFTKSCIEIADKRIENKINRNDYIQLLQVIRDKKSDNVPTNYDDVELISQCFEFFESVILENNLLTTFLAQQLAENSVIQERLHKEMVEVKARIGDNDLNYELLNDMKYAKMVIEEGLRMCSIAPELKRRATKSYVLENINGEKIPVKPGDGVWLPAFILQNDPKYYPNPSVFDPNRYSDENRKAHVPGTFGAFGIGPRDCVGCLYVMVELKITLYHLVLNFIFERGGDNNSIKLKRRK